MYYMLQILEKNLEFKYLTALQCFCIRIFPFLFQLPEAKVKRLKLLCNIRLDNGSVNSKHIVNI
jgi:hypothetical protein